MMPTTKPRFVPLIAFLGLTASMTSMAGNELVVDSDWLAGRPSDDNLILLHVGDRKTYDRKHIQGAHYVSLHGSAFSHADSHGHDGLVLELPELGTLEALLEKEIGASEDSTIVVYWSDGQVTPATRVVFTLDWAGLGDRTVILNGGLESWEASGGSVTAAEPDTGTGTLELESNASLLVDAQWIQAHANDSGIVLLDGRSRAIYDGVREDQDKEGHIPSAKSLPWGLLVNEEGEFRSREEIRAAFTAAGVNEGDTVVAYCHIGQYATAVLFAARTLGHQVRLYDGSFQDWAERDLPVVTD